MKKVDELLLAYLAGLVDGEGTCTFHRSVKLLAPELSVANTDRATVQLFQDTFKVGRIYTEGVPRYRPCYKWKVSCWAALEPLRALYPFLRLKKYHAELLIEAIQLLHARRGGRGHGKPRPARLIEIDNKIRALNRRRRFVE